MTNRPKNIASSPPSFARDEIELAVFDALAHVAAVIELAIDDVNVRVEDERVAMNARAARDCVASLLRPHQRGQHSAKQDGEMAAAEAVGES